MTADSAHNRPGGTAPLLAELERRLLARQELLELLDGASESVCREALLSSDESLKQLLDRLGALYPPADTTATRADEAA